MAVQFQTISGDYSGNVQNAINGSVNTGLPVYGTAGTYTITSALSFPEGAQLIFLPGAVLQWTFTSSAGVISCEPGLAGRARSWRGGKIVSSAMQSGDVFVVTGDLVTIEDVTITGVQTGAAIRVSGNRCFVVNPTISGGPASIGVAINGGSQSVCSTARSRPGRTSFRCSTPRLPR